MGLVTPVSAGAGRPAGAGALRRHRRRGDVRDRPHHAGQGCRGVRERPRPLRAARRARRARRRRARGPRRRANVGEADTVVTTPSAIRDDNPELVEARRRGITVVHRAAALASLMLGKRGIAVSGTHGKTTTTSMLTTVLRHGGADPSYVIGGVLAETGLGADDGSGRLVRGRGGRERRLLPDVVADRPRSSPASRPTTWTTTGPGRDRGDLRRLRRPDHRTAGCSSRAATTPGPRPSPAPRPRYRGPPGAHLRRVARRRLPGDRRRCRAAWPPG